MTDFAGPDRVPLSGPLAAPITPASPISYLQQIAGNGFSATQLFTESGVPQPEFLNLLVQLPLRDPKTGDHLVETLSRTGNLGLPQIEEALQAAFFKPNAAKFSFEVAADGGVPSEEQRVAFRKFGLTDEIRIPSGMKYDTGVVFGGLLGAIEARTNFLLEQGAELGSIALLGGKRALFPDRELGEALTKIIGAEYHQELTAAQKEPATEYELMLVVWEAHCRKEPALRQIPVIAINSDLRLGNIKVAPGTPDTVVDLANSLTAGEAIPGLSNAPVTFLLASNQPHALRQREDFVSSMALLNYPGLAQVDVVGYGCAANTSLKLFSQEVAKLVHAQFLERSGASS